jgi:lipopolysaccharide transport system permease protein
VVFCIFGHLLGVPTGGVPRPVLVFTGLLPWQFFAAALGAASGSLVNNANLISKVYFPRLIVPASAVAVSFVDFLISAAFLAALMALYGVVPDARGLMLPLLVLVAIAAALGAGLWLTALNVKYRDFRYVIPFVVQFGLYVSPVFFSSDVVPARWRFWYALNPMVGVIDGFRWALLGGKFELQLSSLMVSLGIVLLMLTSGIWFFRRIERSFADLI